MAARDTLPNQPEWRISPELRRELLAALSIRPDRGAPLTYEEFLEWADEDTYAEWVDGAVVMASPASERHQDIVRFLIALLSDYVEFRQLGKVYPAPFQMKLEHSGREPDLLYVASEHLDRIKKTYLDGAADLVIEVISPESIGRDRGDKFLEYQRAGIPEYWLIDPDDERAEFYQLDQHGAYRIVELGAHGIYRSNVLSGFWLRPSWLWEEPLPRKDRALIEIGGQDYIRYMEEQLRLGRNGGPSPA